MHLKSITPTGTYLPANRPSDVFLAADGTDCLRTDRSG
jgi:hypothetical protein